MNFKPVWINLLRGRFSINSSWTSSPFLVYRKELQHPGKKSSNAFRNNPELHWISKWFFNSHILSEVLHMHYLHQKALQVMHNLLLLLIFLITSLSVYYTLVPWKSECCHLSVFSYFHWHVSVFHSTTPLALLLN